MDKDYSVCEDWGEGSGLQVYEKECNVGKFKKLLPMLVQKCLAPSSNLPKT